MKSAHTTAVLSCLLIVTFGAVGDAMSQTPFEKPAPPLHSIWLEAGFGAPSGGYGIHYQLNLPIVSPGLHVGRGFSGNLVGVSLAFHPWDRIQELSADTSADKFLELSYSAGFQNEGSHMFPKGIYHWLHIGGGVEVRFHALCVTFGGGVEALLTGPGGAHVDLADVSLFTFDGFTPVPWLRLGLGFSF